MTAYVNDMAADSGARCAAVLTAMGAAGWVKRLPHGALAYEPRGSVLCVAIHYYAVACDESADISPSWQEICRYVEAAGASAHRLEIPGDRELADALENGDLADIAAPGWTIYTPDDSVLGRQWSNGVLSWRLPVPGAPWVPGEGDVYLMPESREVARWPRTPWRCNGLATATPASRGYPRRGLEGILTWANLRAELTNLRGRSDHPAALSHAHGMSGTVATRQTGLTHFRCQSLK